MPWEQYIDTRCGFPSSAALRDTYKTRHFIQKFVVWDPAQHGGLPAFNSPTSWQPHDLILAYAKQKSEKKERKSVYKKVLLTMMSSFISLLYLVFFYTLKAKNFARCLLQSYTIDSQMHIAPWTRRLDLVNIGARCAGWLTKKFVLVLFSAFRMTSSAEWTNHICNFYKFDKEIFFSLSSTAVHWMSTIAFPPS